MADNNRVQPRLNTTRAHLHASTARTWRAVMRKIVLSLAAAGAALVVASPAAAQYYPQPQQQPYGYGNAYGGQPYGGGYGGYGFNNYGQVRALQARIDRTWP